MKCQNCGTEFSEGLFCPECGAKNTEEEERLKREEEERREREEKEREEREKADAARKAEEAERLKRENEERRKREEENSRTFNGCLYATVEEMQQAKNSMKRQHSKINSPSGAMHLRCGV